MPTTKRTIDFFATDIGLQIEEMLHQMTLDAAFNTQSGYTANTIRYPDNSISFVDKHKDYLMTHPSVNPTDYLSNLRLKTRLR